MDPENSEESNGPHTSHFLVLDSQTESQYSPSDQQRILESLPGLQPEEVQEVCLDETEQGDVFPRKSTSLEDEDINAVEVLVPGTDSEMEIHRDISPTEVHIVLDSQSEDDHQRSSSSDKEGSPDVTVIRKQPDEGERDTDQIQPGSSKDLGIPPFKLFPSTPSQQDMFGGQATSGDDKDQPVATPSEYIGSLHLSCEPMIVPETVDESLTELSPSPDAYGSTPVIIPSSPYAVELEDDPEDSVYDPRAVATLGQKREIIMRKQWQSSSPDSNSRSLVKDDETDGPSKAQMENLQEDEAVCIPPVVSTLHGEGVERQSDSGSLHLIYSASEAQDTDSKDRVPQVCPAAELTEGNPDQSKELSRVEELYQDSQDLALHFSPSQGTSHGTSHHTLSQDVHHSFTPQGDSLTLTGNSQKTKEKIIGGKSLSQPGTSSDKLPATCTKSRSTSTDSRGSFHLSLPGQGQLLHPAASSSPREGQGSEVAEASDRDTAPQLQTVPSLSLGNVDSESQAASDTSFRIERPEQVAEPVEESSEVNVFKKTKSSAGKQQADVPHKMTWEESSEDLFHVAKPSLKRRQASSVPSGETSSQHGGKVPKMDKPDEVIVDPDAETQPDCQEENSPEKPKSDAVMFEESTETYDYKNQEDMEVIGPIEEQEPADAEQVLQTLKSNSQSENKSVLADAAELGSRVDQSKRKSQENSRQTSQGLRSLNVEVQGHAHGGVEACRSGPVEPRPSTSRQDVILPLEKRTSDPYTFHASQSQKLNKEKHVESTVVPALPVTPLSSKKTQRVTHKRTLQKRVAKKRVSLSSSPTDEGVQPSHLRRRKPKQAAISKFTRMRRKVSDDPPRHAEPSNVMNVPVPPVEVPSAFEHDVLMSQKSLANQSRSESAGHLGDESHLSSSFRRSGRRKVVEFSGIQDHTGTPMQLSWERRLSGSQLSDQIMEQIIVEEVTTRTIRCTRKTTVKKILVKDGTILDTQVTEEEKEPVTVVIERNHTEKNNYLSPLSPSRSGSTVTSGDLADVSSSWSRSNSSSKGSNSASLEKTSPSLDVVSPSQIRKDDTVHLPAPGRSQQKVVSPPASVDREESHKLQESSIIPAEIARASEEENSEEAKTHYTTPDQSTIEKTDSRLGVVVSSAGSQRASDSLFTSPEPLRDPQVDVTSPVPSTSRHSDQPVPPSPLRREAADSSQDSSDIPPGQVVIVRTRSQESGGFSVHGSGVILGSESRSTRSEADTPPPRKRPRKKNNLGSEVKAARVGSSEESSNVSPEIPVQTEESISTMGIKEKSSNISHYASNLEIGATVMARWKDGFFYPGRILSMDKATKYRIKFEDGDLLMVKTKDILLLRHLPIGQSVMVMSQDGYFDCGMVVDLIDEQDDLLYKVEKDDGKTRRCSRSQIILSEDQASCLMSDEEVRVTSSAIIPSTSKTADVSLDNLVEGKRRGTSKKEVESSKKSDKPAPPYGRRKTRKTGEGPAATSTPTPKGKRQDQQMGQKTGTPWLQSPLGGAVSSPSVRRRSPRKVRVGLFEDSVPLKKNLFRGMVFLLTHVVKSQEQKKQEKKILQDSSLDASTDDSATEDEPAVPFDKDQIRTRIEGGGGDVLEKYNKIQIEASRQCFLISDTYQRTVKYFECLAAGIPCVSHLWIRDSCRQGKLLPYKAYILPAGISLERRKLMEWNSKGSCLSGLKVMVTSTNTEFQDAWTSVLTIARCHLTNRLPGPGVSASDELAVDVIISDSTCQPNVSRRARQLGIPIVSTEWVIQCLINAVQVSLTGHQRYKHDNVEKC